jgi:hypothetical protein
MRVRPIFWILLALSCAGVLLFAVTVHLPVPAVMQVHFAQTHPTSSGFEASVELHLSDAQGIPIDQAQITPDAYMTNMNMSAEHIQVFTRGSGNYEVFVPLSMAGPWAIHIAAAADGFDTQQQTLHIQVV